MLARILSMGSSLSLPVLHTYGNNCLSFRTFLSLSCHAVGYCPSSGSEWTIWTGKWSYGNRVVEGMASVDKEDMHESVMVMGNEQLSAIWLY